MVLGAVVRPFVKQAAQYVYRGLRQQDRIIDYTYRKTGLYNRGVVRGIKHGLIAGQIVGGGLELGLNAPDTPGNDGSIFQPRNGTTSYKQNKTRSRRSKRFNSRNCIQRYPATNRRRTYTRRY